MFPYTNPVPVLLERMRDDADAAARRNELLEKKVVELNRKLDIALTMLTQIANKLNIE